MPSAIAVVGLACRFPGDASDPEKFWRVLWEGRDCWSAVPRERFTETSFLRPQPDHHASHNHQGGHFLSQDIGAFDARFFNLTRAEADAMDPQQRLSLEISYEALENAGMRLNQIRGSQTAVYVSMFTRDYDRNIFKDPFDIPKYHLTGSGEAILANRLSYFYDLKGPSVSLDTGCSGSLVAVHQACQSLVTGESEMAMASGVNLILSPDHMLGMSNM